MRIEWTERAQRDAQKLQRRDRERVVEALGRYAHTSHGGIRKLRGLDPPSLRLRVGDYRVILRREGEVLRRRPCPLLSERVAVAVLKGITWWVSCSTGGPARSGHEPVRWVRQVCCHVLVHTHGKLATPQE